MAKFFTWIEQTYTEQALVPPRLQTHIRELWLQGASPKELAATFLMPLEWVEEFVRRDTRDTPTH